jgi:acyl carrier protein
VTAPLPFDEFWHLVTGELAVADLTTATEDTRLSEDLFFDSVLTFELILLVEELAGVLLPEEMLGQLQTVGDVYDVYCTRVTQ